MRTFSMHPLAAAIFLSMVFLGGLGAFVVVPIVGINWIWNAFVAQCTQLPEIALWQAALLYASFATISYLLGFLQIEFRAET